MTACTFNHEAMATTFQIVIEGATPDYARQASAAAFRELDRLESELSRFVESSDIARINRLGQEAECIIGDDALRCLLDAAQLSALTNRAFDPTYLSPSSGNVTDAPLFALDPENHLVRSLTPKLTLDLGAFGKGYALDRMGEILAEWEIPRACLQAGGSSVLAVGAASWPMTIGPRTAQLRNEATSASGLDVQGAHIADPRRRTAATRARRVWSFASTAAESDALSTAFFVMSDAEVAAFCATHPAFGAALLQPDGALIFFGNTPALTEE
ncbi:FAD:protein FMN transferase [Oleiharenicola lentus]|uniref:FAD:protein FMN transferase n=1 Tax=Oleiharenicola lentus TaxID=2508720 RepID=UPI003F668A6A